MLVRTEFSFGVAFGSVEAALARLPRGGIIADTTCFGHVPFAKAAKAAGKRAVLGWRVRVVERLEDAPGWREVALIPRTPDGLRDLYATVKLAEGQFRYTPRLSAGDLARALAGGVAWYVAVLPGRSGEPVRLPEGGWLIRPRLPTGPARGGAPGASPLVCSDNFYPSPGDREAWTFACPRGGFGVGPGHILTPAEMTAEGLGEPDWDWLESLDTPLPRVENIRFGAGDPDAELRAQCEAELTRRGLGPAYRERMDVELGLIAEKRFADYFLVIGDMLRWAKQRMLVGPARGSSCGSLVCWLTRITEVDPLVHGLIFERFVDLNRMDLPDIDIDFPDVKRHLVVEYLAERYGQENVAHLGTVLRYKPKSALTDAAKVLRVPERALSSLKDVLLERSSGDARVNDCLLDSFTGLDSGKRLLLDHPKMIVATRLEGAAKTSGTHAAGIIVCNRPVSEFCAIGRGGIAQLDKKGAEAINALKIDALGLRTLSVLEAACEAAGLEFESLYDLPLDDPAAYAVLNDGRYSGVFQFEGLALQGLAAQIQFREFDDLAAVGALARPGPLSSGEAQRWIRRHSGQEKVVAPHPTLEALTRDTYGVIMYQEQVMRITRELAGFSWKETGDIRKLMSSRLGDESFDRWTSRFIDGCVGRGVPRGEAESVWKAINTFGSWAFNKSHSVAYGIVSYWCCWLKAHHPLAFALGCLQHAKDDDSAIKMLRELTREGIEFVPLDPERSRAEWSVQDGKLYGGLRGVKGIGPVTALEIESRIRNGIPLRPSHKKLLEAGSKFANLYPTRTRWADAYAGKLFKNGQQASEIVEVTDFNRQYIIVGKLVKKNQRDMNEDKLVSRRNGVRVKGQSLILLVTLEDDSDRIMCIIDRQSYERLGKPLVEKGMLGQWLAIKGTLNKGFRAMNVQNVRWIGDE